MDLSVMLKNEPVWKRATAEECGNSVVTLFSDLTKMVTMQNLFMMEDSHLLELPQAVIETNGKIINKVAADWTEIIGLTASAISSLTFVPQVYRAWKTKRVADLSMLDDVLCFFKYHTLVYLWCGQSPFFADHLQWLHLFLSVVLIYFKLTFPKK